jgi:hypothetical protein
MASTQAGESRTCDILRGDARLDKQDYERNYEGIEGDRFRQRKSEDRETKNPVTRGRVARDT